MIRLTSVRSSLPPLFVLDTHEKVKMLYIPVQLAKFTSKTAAIREKNWIISHVRGDRTKIAPV
jgi:hypothetical protein